MTKLHYKQVRPLLLWMDARVCVSSVGGMWFAWFMRLGMEGEGTSLPGVSPPINPLYAAKIGPSAFFALGPLWSMDSTILVRRHRLPGTIGHTE